MVMCLHLKGFFVTSTGPSLQQAQVTIAPGDAAKCGYCVQTNTPQGLNLGFCETCVWMFENLNFT